MLLLLRFYWGVKFIFVMRLHSIQYPAQEFS